MAKRRRIRRVKIHRTYTIAEAADVVGAHKHTVSRWIAAGLPTTDSKRPLLIHGADLRAFLREREPIDDSASALPNADLKEVQDT